VVSILPDKLTGPSPAFSSRNPTLSRIIANRDTRRERGSVVSSLLAKLDDGIGELGFGPPRAQMHPDRVKELEARYPRDGFRSTAMRLIDQEVRRIPDGRFALLVRFSPRQTFTPTCLGGLGGLAAHSLFLDRRRYGFPRKPPRASELANGYAAER
jgi:hypothetical protein